MGHHSPSSPSSSGAGGGRHRHHHHHHHHGGRSHSSSSNTNATANSGISKAPREPSVRSFSSASDISSSEISSSSSEASSVHSRSTPKIAAVIIAAILVITGLVGVTVYLVDGDRLSGGGSGGERILAEENDIEIIREDVAAPEDTSLDFQVKIVAVSLLKVFPQFSKKQLSNKIFLTFLL